MYDLNSVSDSRTILDHEFDHTKLFKSVDNKFHSVLGSDMLNNQSNNSFTSFESNSEVDVNVCKIFHKSNTVCNFNAHIDTLLYDNFDFAVYPDSNVVSVMLQQAVPCIGWRDWLKGTSPQAHRISTNLGGGLKDTNTDTNKEILQLEHDGCSFGSVRPGVSNNLANTVSHHINFNGDGAGTSPVE